MNLYGKGDFVSELTPKQCVSAAMQIMLNVIGPNNDRTSRTQTALAKLALLDYPILFVIVQQGANAIALSRVVRKLPDELSDEDLGIPSEWLFVG